MFFDDYKIYNSKGSPCDNFNGHCSCGAYHNPIEFATRIEEKYGKTARDKFLWEALQKNFNK